MNNESFDAIYYAALQVVVVATANGVRERIFFASEIWLIVNTVGAFDVFDDRRRILCVVLLLHCGYHRPQFLAHQSIRRGHYKYFRRHQVGDEEKCFWRRSVSI